MNFRFKKAIFFIYANYFQNKAKLIKYGGYQELVLHFPKRSQYQTKVHVIIIIIIDGLLDQTLLQILHCKIASFHI